VNVIFILLIIFLKHILLNFDTTLIIASVKYHSFGRADDMLPRIYAGPQNFSGLQCCIFPVQRMAIANLAANLYTSFFFLSEESDLLARDKHSYNWH